MHGRSYDRFQGPRKLSDALDGASMAISENPSTLGQAVKRQHDLLNEVFALYEHPADNGISPEIRADCLMAAMFLFEYAVEFANIRRNGCIGFAGKVALKGLIHKLIEYDRNLYPNRIKKMISHMESRGASISFQQFIEGRKKWGAYLHKLNLWTDLRNKVTGHSDPDTALQVRLIEEIDHREVMEVAEAYLHFNLEVLRIYADVVGSNANP